MNSAAVEAPVIDPMITFLMRQGYNPIRRLDDGTYIAIGNLVFTKALYVGCDRFGYKHRFCFRDLNECLAQFDAYTDILYEPTGWIARR